MRVIAGMYKGRVIKMPRGVAMRPTQDRVRESIFEIIKAYLPDAEVLELFAGSGALGVEALSRGARSVMFVEKDSRCVKTIEENLTHVGVKDLLLINYGLSSSRMNFAVQPEAVIIQSDIFKALACISESSSKFGIVIADPPYGTDHARKILIKLDTYDILKKPFVIIIEHSKKDVMSHKEGNIILLKQYKYGATILSVYRGLLQLEPSDNR